MKNKKLYVNCNWVYGKLFKNYFIPIQNDSIFFSKIVFEKEIVFLIFKSEFKMLLKILIFKEFEDDSFKIYKLNWSNTNFLTYLC